MISKGWVLRIDTNGGDRGFVQDVIQTENVLGQGACFWIWRNCGKNNRNERDVDETVWVVMRVCGFELIVRDVTSFKILFTLWLRDCAGR